MTYQICDQDQMVVLFDVLMAIFKILKTRDLSWSPSSWVEFGFGPPFDDEKQYLNWKKKDCEGEMPFYLKKKQNSLPLI